MQMVGTFAMLTSVLQGFLPMYKHMHTNCRFLLTEAVKLLPFCSLSVPHQCDTEVHSLSLSITLCLSDTGGEVIIGAQACIER